MHSNRNIRPFTVDTSVLTDTGCVRELNEDCCTVQKPADPAALESKGILLVVADGMGGSLAGEVASRAAVDSVAASYYSSPYGPREALALAFHEANRHVHKLSHLRGDWSGMGTTCTALVIHDEVAYSAHVGDSRLYLIRSSSIYQMTEDHSVVKELVKRGALTADAARRHPERNIILRALGCHGDINVATWEQPLPVRPGDCFVLCSDGLHDTVADDEICLVGQSLDASTACQSLVETARSRGGRDNITVAIAQVRG